MKYIIIIAFLFILFSLGQALFYMVKGKGKSQNTVRFLTVRIVASVLLFMLLLLAMKMGWVVPHGTKMVPG
ncbi:twin transmembrane helix small protein [Marinicella rhabdoformis]|uniref:twin transmembrane helix small protein n=1 Tax=Marinicella rhabdoformis TaxID=2580566 RepID=UPI0012AEB486|nr:twin transmembrane helix small protein [Marinicella rhabdoformis]